MGFYPSEGDVDSNGAEEVNLRSAAGAELLGQQVSAASLPVVISSNQSVIQIATESNKQTYGAAFSNLVIGATPQDVFTIIGSATKTIRIISIRLSTSTTAGSGVFSNITLVKRSTADTGGTSTTATLVPYDSANAAATVVVRGYTVNPTLGTAVGPIRARRWASETASQTPLELLWEFGDRPGQNVFLRGISQQLCVNFGGSIIAGGIADFSIEWIEE